MVFLLAFRLILIYGAFILGAIYVLWISLSSKNTKRNSYKYILFLSYIFPLIETSVNVLDGITVGGTLTLLFCILNYRIFYDFTIKKYWAIYLIIITFIISGLFSPYPLNSFLSLYKYILGFIFYLIVLKSVEYKSISYVGERIFKFVTFWTIAFFLIQLFIPNFSLLTTFKDPLENRFNSCFQDSQMAGLVTAIICVFYFNKYLENRNNKLLWLIIGCTIFIGLTGSKSGIIGVGLGLMCSFLFHKVPTSFIVSVPVFIAAIYVTSPYWQELSAFKRMSDLENSTEVRTGFWKQALNIHNDYPLLGIGPGNFNKYISDRHIPMTHWHGGNPIYANQPESGYLMWLDEVGIIGCLMWLIIIIFIIQKRGNKEFNVSELVPLAISFIGLYTLNRVDIMYVAFCTAALISCSGTKPFKRHISYKKISCNSIH